MLIILEGIDKSGKTFLGKKLAEMLNIPYFKGKKAPKTKKELKTKGHEVAKIEIEMLYELVKQTGISLVVDRFHISEYVYAKAYGRELDEKFIWDMDKKFAELGTYIVYFTAKDEILKARWSDEHIVDFNKVKTLKLLYSQALLKTKCSVIIVNTSYDITTNLRIIEHVAKELETELTISRLEKIMR